MNEDNPTDPSPVHFELVGRFIYGCTDVEIGLAEAMRKTVGIENDEIARAVIGIGDLKVKDYIEVIKRASAILGIENPELTLLFKWITYFNDVRNVIAHKPFLVHNGVMAYSNYHTAKSIRKVWVYQCTVDQMNNACDMLAKVYRALLIVDLTKEAKPAFTGTRHDLIGEPNEALLRKLGLPDRPADTRPQSAK